MIIRKYKESDLESCTKLIKETSEKYIIDDIIPGKESEFIGFFDLDTNKGDIEKFFLDAETFVAEDEKKEVIGVLRATENRMRSFFVRLDKIHQGVGKALFNEYLKSIEGKYEFIYLFSSSYAVEFYKKLGFETLGEKSLRDEGIRVHPMKKWLN